MGDAQPDVWLRGPVPGVPPVLMPVAHALLQTVEDVERATEGLSIEELWARPGGAAAIGFHLKHLAGATDRLFTYARGEPLSEAQRAALAAEREPADPPENAAALLAAFRAVVERAIDQLRRTPDSSLAERRTIGRAALPTTVVGLLVHAAEHAQRHAGQVVTTAKIVRAGVKVQPASPP
ncbi:MAG TPA: DinB family protein [Vicinamibacterales bacterium]|nr:DinB family protein [Vicinamibacterales bacterium]